MVENKAVRRISSITLHTIFIIICAMYIVPLVLLVSVSISDEIDIVKYGFSVIPRTVNLASYRFIFADPTRIIDAYKITILISVVGTVSYLLIAGLCAYALSRQGFRYRKAIAFFLYFPMLFSGGTIPSYILMTQVLHLKDTIWALILPLIGSVWYLLIMRTFFAQIPQDIFESAAIDGASESHIFMSMVLPLSKPVLATIGLFQVLGCWNSWFQALLYINDAKLYPLQYLLQNMLRSIEVMMSLPQGAKMGEIPTESTRMAMCILAAGPMLLVFPFFQKYFTKGITVGSLKG